MSGTEVEAITTSQRNLQEHTPTAPRHLKAVSDETRRDAALSDSDLWLRYFELGGMRGPAEVESYLNGSVTPSTHDHDVLAHALNERLSETDGEYPVGYAGMSTTPAVVAPVAVPPQLGLLGSFSINLEGDVLRLPMNTQRVISFLALHDGVLQRQHVAGSLWGDSTERRAAGSLRSALWRLQHPLVQVVAAGLKLSEDVGVDLRESEALARRILDDSQDLSETDMDGKLLSADLLPDWTEDWVLVKREQHTNLRLHALEALCSRLTTMGRFGQAVQAGLLAVSGEPLRESAQRALIAALIAQGNIAQAHERYDAFSLLLREELDIEPSAEMKDLVSGVQH